MSKSSEEYKRLKKKLAASAGLAYVKRMTLHERSLHIFEGNCIDLTRALDYVEATENILNLWAEDNRDKQQFAHREVVRHFHNVVSAAQSLVEHTRNFMSIWHKDTPIHGQYSRKIKAEFAEDPLARFVQDLRNYFLHKEIPPSKMVLTFNVDTKDPPKSRVLLRLNDLKRWNRWKKESKVFLESRGEDMELRDLLNQYRAKVTTFYRWFREEMDSWHMHELTELPNLREEIERYQKAAF